MRFISLILLFVYGSRACGQCIGGSNCSACKNCSRCRHCGSGGVCGVCSPESFQTAKENRSSKKPEGKPIVGTADSSPKVIKIRKEPAKIKSDSINLQVFTLVDFSPVFPGGTVAMYRFVKENVKYPPKAKEQRLSGKCFLNFVVNEDGSITDVRVLKGVPSCLECDEEAVKVVKSMPLWSPGILNNKPVKTYYDLPVSFKID